MVYREKDIASLQGAISEASFGSPTANVSDSPAFNTGSYVDPGRLGSVIFA